MAAVLRALETKTPFVAECQRLMDERLKATTTDEREDAEWALTYVFQMNRTGRLEEYFAQQLESRPPEPREALR